MLLETQPVQRLVHEAPCHPAPGKARSVSPRANVSMYSCSTSVPQAWSTQGVSLHISGIAYFDKQAQRTVEQTCTRGECHDSADTSAMTADVTAVRRRTRPVRQNAASATVSSRWK